MATKKAPAKKEPVKTEEPEVTLEQLVAAAEDFNSFMFAAEEEKIPLDLEYDQMLDEVTDSAKQLEAEDIISADTADTLEALKIGFSCQVAETDDAGEATTDSDNEPADEATEAQKATDIALVKKSKDMDKIKNVAKLYAIRIPPPMLKDLAKLKTYVIGKLEGGATPAPAKEPKEKKTKAPAEPGLNKFLEETIPSGLGKRHEDEIVLLAKEKFPDKPYRVIGNAIYAHCRKLTAK